MWERRHGLGASKRTGGGQREYTKVDLDHLKLVKQLTDKGMRIKDIAKLPKKTLSILADKSEPEVSSLQQQFKTVVIGDQLSLQLRLHASRYRQLSIEFPSISVAQWLVEVSDDCAAKIVMLQVDTIESVAVNKLKQLKQLGVSVYIFGREITADKLAVLNQQGIPVFNSPIDLELIDKITAKACQQQAYISGLFDTSRQFDLPLPSSVPRFFDDEFLASIMQQESLATCKCPSHLSNLIRSINEFEEYSKQCEADNWKDASVHACIYAYSVQARSMLEKALLAALDDD
ncbi:MAG: DNA-binding transcriptional MerR regulator [Oceanicoccus sp.]|jgi:DNA-binding transcriptional MerR regulator